MPVDSIARRLNVAHVLDGSAGRHYEALQVLRELQGRRRLQYLPAGLLAGLHAGLGDTDRALDLFEEAFEEGSLTPEVGFDPMFVSLRSEPRLRVRLGKLGLR